MTVLLIHAPDMTQQVFSVALGVSVFSCFWL